jgi:hypothetical protein
MNNWALSVLGATVVCAIAACGAPAFTSFAVSDLDAGSQVVSSVDGDPSDTISDSSTPLVPESSPLGSDSSPVSADAGSDVDAADAGRMCTCYTPPPGGNPFPCPC